MARTSAPVIYSQTFDDGMIWEILGADATYVITYKNQPIGIRVTNIFSKDVIRYKKMTYTNLGNAIAQVKQLNQRFNCEDFGIIEVTADEI